MRPSKARILKARKRVSIHASVKDATFIMYRSFADVPVSIHASVKDATYIWRKNGNPVVFQSTHL